jgi:hypothetical protein
MATGCGPVRGPTVDHFLTIILCAAPGGAQMSTAPVDMASLQGDRARSPCREATNSILLAPSIGLNCPFREVANGRPQRTARRSSGRRYRRPIPVSGCTQHRRGRPRTWRDATTGPRRSVHHRATCRVPRRSADAGLESGLVAAAGAPAPTAWPRRSRRARSSARAASRERVARARTVAARQPGRPRHPHPRLGERVAEEALAQSARSHAGRASSRPGLPRPPRSQSGTGSWHVPEQRPTASALALCRPATPGRCAKDHQKLCLRSFAGGIRAGQTRCATHDARHRAPTRVLPWRYSTRPPPASTHAPARAALHAPSFKTSTGTNFGTMALRRRHVWLLFFGARSWPRGVPRAWGRQVNKWRGKPGRSVNHSPAEGNGPRSGPRVRGKVPSGDTQPE